MLIAIPSAGRAQKQITLRSLKIARLLSQTVVVVPQRERLAYLNMRDCEVVHAPDEVAGIGKTREWIMSTLAPQRGERQVIMLDDDMDFCWRPDITKPELVTIKDEARMYAMISTLMHWFDDGFVHVGLSARQGNNHETVLYKDATRMMNAYAYDVVRLREIGVELGRVPVMEDFDLTLQLLRRGYPNRVSYEYCWNQRGSGSTGGCSTYRTPELQRDAALRLKELHPDFVRVTTKESKTNWKGMQERYDVNVYWQKAYASSKGVRP